MVDKGVNMRMQLLNNIKLISDSNGLPENIKEGR
jgi:hypothetical protein